LQAAPEPEPRTAVEKKLIGEDGHRRVTGFQDGAEAARLAIEQDLRIHPAPRTAMVSPQRRGSFGRPGLLRTQGSAGVRVFAGPPVNAKKNPLEDWSNAGAHHRHPAHVARVDGSVIGDTDADQATPRPDSACVIEAWY